MVLATLKKELANNCSFKEFKWWLLHAKLCSLPWLSYLPAYASPHPQTQAFHSEHRDSHLLLICMEVRSILILLKTVYPAAR